VKVRILVAEPCRKHAMPRVVPKESVGGGGS
jgi:hypothetical protein